MIEIKLDDLKKDLEKNEQTQDSSNAKGYCACSGSIGASDELI